MHVLGHRRSLVGQGLRDAHQGWRGLLEDADFHDVAAEPLTRRQELHGCVHVVRL